MFYLMKSKYVLFSNYNVLSDEFKKYIFSNFKVHGSVLLFGGHPVYNTVCVLVCLRILVCKSLQGKCGHASAFLLTNHGHSDP